MKLAFNKLYVVSVIISSDVNTEFAEAQLCQHFRFISKLYFGTLLSPFILSKLLLNKLA